MYVSKWLSSCRSLRGVVSSFHDPRYFKCYLYEDLDSSTVNCCMSQSLGTSLGLVACLIVWSSRLGDYSGTISFCQWTKKKNAHVIGAVILFLAYDLLRELLMAIAPQISEKWITVDVFQKKEPSTILTRPRCGAKYKSFFCLREIAVIDLGRVDSCSKVPVSWMCWFLL